jgi:hypothetical protein
MSKHFGDWKEKDLVKAMIDGSVPSDRQYDNIMNDLNIKKIDFEEIDTEKIQIQVPENIENDVEEKDIEKEEDENIELKKDVEEKNIEVEIEEKEIEKDVEDVEIEKNVEDVKKLITTISEKTISELFDKKQSEIENIINSKFEEVKQYIKEVVKEVQPVDQVQETNDDQGEDVLDHVMTAEELPPVAPKKGFNPESIRDLSESLNQLKTVLKAI